MSPESFRLAVAQYMRGHAYSGIAFTEELKPPQDQQQDDYAVAYEATFQPADLERAYLKIFVTEDGKVDIGFETRKVARRLGTKLRAAKGAFAAGRELASIAPTELIAFVDLVAQGKVLLQATLGLFGLSKCRAMTSESDLKSVRVQNARHWDWLAERPEGLSDNRRRRLLCFRHW